MQTLAQWPSPNDLNFLDRSETSSAIPNPDEYIQSILAWAKEKQAGEYFFVPLEEWPPREEYLSSLPSYPISNSEKVLGTSSLSYLLPPVLFGNKLCIWTTDGDGKSLTDSYFHVLEKIGKAEAQLSGFFGEEIQSILKIVWKEEEKHSVSYLLEKKLWGKKENGQRLSSPLSPESAFFVGSLTDIREITEYELNTETNSELEAAILRFLFKRTNSKYFSLLGALGKSGAQDRFVILPKTHFSFGLQLLLLFTVFAEAYEELVSLWIEERPQLKDALIKLEEWTHKESHPHSESGMYAIFEERIVRLLDKYSDRTDRFLLKRLEEEYFRSKKNLISYSTERKTEIEEKLIPDLLSQLDSHSKLKFPEDLQSEWEKIGKTLQDRLENLLSERKNLLIPSSEGDGKSPESWNILIGQRSD
ncbi:hypothetical protein [Leptospira sarikeiensis]|uniref:Uncharacterized protein n=1 Tax=Leptospira sarikeiensis TaxID=2484943 RepID=A0A4R9K618_9LEPT|nr:hypothetical protein [Leptospira sarikeiensis]TGL61689.1 hypothetical protein EHQ64_10000 [Leptospira sarikeiensis]